MALPPISDSDREALDILFGQALLCDDIHNKLLKQQTRMEALARINLSLHIWSRIMAIGDIPDLHELAVQLFDFLDPPDTLM